MPNIQLDWFELDWMLRATLKSDWVPVRWQRMVGSLSSDQRRPLEQEAAQRCRSLVSRGIISCSASAHLPTATLDR